MLSKLQKSNLENRIIYSIHRSRIPDNIYPARGRKLAGLYLDEITLDVMHSRQYLPRKGTETRSCGVKMAEERDGIPDNIYPARGRKQSPRMLPRK